MKKDLYCVICGNLKEEPFFPLCRKCAPHFYNKGCHPHQKARNRKIWIKNRAIHIEKAGIKCEWCSSDKPPFSIHHPRGINARTYDYMWEEIINERVIKLLKDDPILRKKLELSIKLGQKKVLKEHLEYLEERAAESQMKVCPSCLSNRIRERKKLTPRYRCDACKNEFETPINRTQQRYVKAIENQKSKLKSGNYSYISISPNITLGPLYPLIYEDALATYKNKVQELISDYENMTDVTVLCKKCHSATRFGLIICDKCKKGYHNMRHEVCFSCYKEEKGIDKKKGGEFDWDSGDWGEDEDDWDYDGKVWNNIDNDLEPNK